ncbi:MAG: hypothetical protein AB7S78_08575 [Candidatus Omnitrophota bacterium]
MKKRSWGKIGGLITTIMLGFASAAFSAVGDPCVPPATGCYCDDGPSGNVNCRIYGWENGGYMLDGNAGLGTIPSLRINLSYTSNTTPNVGEAECWDISNTSIIEYFIPTATQTQWNSFKAAVLGGSFLGVTMAECPTCGDGVCSNAVTYWGFQESCGSNDSMLPAPETGDPMCTSDCGACPIVCGDGFCAVGTEHCTGGAGPGYNPCVECGACSCGDSHFDCTGQCGTCGSCSPCCGDGTCDGTEDSVSCASDCAVPVCGDLICNGVENKCTCPGDCTTDVCGDGCCTGTETCGTVNSGFSCNADCGFCSCTGAVPINSTLCPGDNAGLTANTPNSSVATCTAGTKCEYLCDDYTKLSSGECRYCLEPPVQACYAIAPACASYTDCPVSLSDGCQVSGSNCRYNYTGDCSINPCGDEYTCGSCTFVCTGAAPANASICSGDNAGLTRGDVPITLVASCTGPTKCEYSCNAGYYYSAGSCVPYVCTGAVPTNSSLCAGDDTGLSADTPRTPVSACTAGTKCEYLCDPGYYSDGTACVLFQCTGPAPAHSNLCCVDYDLDTICEPDDTGLTADTPNTLVDTCTQPVKCEHVCRPFYVRSGITCVPLYLCTGPDPTNSTICLNDNDDLPANTPKTAVITGGCTAGTQCEYECNAGFVLDGNDCRAPACTGVPDPNSVLCAGDNAGLTVDVSVSTVNTCTFGTKCEYRCNTEYHDAGVNQCDVNVCTGSAPSNATLCAGDGTNITGRANLALTLVGACTATKCEYICDPGYELNLAGTACVVETFDCIGTPASNSTICPGDNIGLLADTPVTTVSACTATMCEYTCNSGYKDAGINQCDANVCTGAPPANATLCIGDNINIPGNGDVTRTLVAACTAGTKCEYTCSSGFNFNGTICVANVCTGAVPPNAGLCTGDGTNIPGNSDVARTLVPVCTIGTKCEYTCSNGYNYDAGVCDLNACTGTVPSNATLCAGDDTGIPGNSDVVRTAVGACTLPIYCQYLCNDGFHESGGVCDVNICTGTVPSNATLCSGDDTNIPGNLNVGRTVANACTGGTKCEYTCDPGFTKDANTCRPFMCTGTPDANALICPGDNTGLLADTPVTTVSACTVTLCEYTCNSGYHDGGANQCDVNVCTGATPSNASICSGDGTNIPGNSDVSRTLVGACTAGTKCEYICNDGYNFGGASCDVNICTGAIPINATICSGDDINIPGNADVGRTVVAACTAGTKCEYICDDGFNFDGSGCTNLNQCIGAVPANTTICSGDDANIPGNSDVPRTVVPACTVGTKCEYICTDTYHDGGGVCDPNICIGSVPANAAYCSGDDTNIPGGTNMNRSLVITCGAPKCEYQCNSGYSVDAGACAEDGEWIKIQQTTQLIPFSPACGAAFSGYPGYTINEGAPCPAAFLGDLYHCWKLGADVLLQCHQSL